MNYQRHYDVRFIDDIHNYFPAVLYEPERFHTVGDLLGYVRSQVRDHFDLFSAANRAYVPQTRVIVPNLQVFPAHIHPPYTHAHAHAHAPMPAPMPPATPPPRVVRTAAVPLEMNSLTTQLISEMLGVRASPLNLHPRFETESIWNILGGLAGASSAAAFQEPVPVRPTAQQVLRASTLSTVNTAEQVCAICQDSMEQGSSARTLNSCHHGFHQACIDTWFTTNVHCPVCRHDIRERTATSQEAVSTPVTEDDE